MAPDLDEALLEVADGAWVVRVLGRGGSGDGRSAPLLLLGFWRADTPTGDPEREAFVVGRTLAAQSPESLEKALQVSRRAGD